MKAMTEQHLCRQLLKFIDNSPSPWHAVKSIEDALLGFKFTRLYETDKWDLQAGGRYYVIRDDSSIIVFVSGQKPLSETGFKIISAHTDSPGLRIKPHPGLLSFGLLRLSVEIYGGPLLATFADRDLSLAGRVSYKNEQGEIASSLLKFEQPLLRLPNLAIHLNRNVNQEGLKFNKQDELPLILASLTEEQLPETYFTNLLQQQSELDISRILSFDLAVYDTQKGVIWGSENEFYANSQLDNLASCHAILTSLLDDKVLSSDATLVCAFFDHEEIGSETHIGAGGGFFVDMLERVFFSFETAKEDFSRAMARSFMISCDMAHAFQPNFPGAYDIEHKVMVNQGPVIKMNVNHRYSSESISYAVFADCCERADVPYQTYSHRNDLACGTTIGPVTSAKSGIRAVDVGCPLWGMHSIRESAGVLDHYYMIKALTQFFK
jgi:aspartyl aminopeptidase